jgi:hypothetical protein
MGQTPNPKPQPPKAPPKPPSGDGEGASGSGGDTPVDFCLMTHTITVALDAEAGIEIADIVHLGLGSPPSVLCGATKVGTLSDSIANALARCLIDGYHLVGKVDSIDLERKRAQITVAGKRTGA